MHTVISYKPVSQSCTVAKSEKFWQATGQSLDVRMAGCNGSFQYLTFLLIQLHFHQWSSLPFCLPSLIVQRPARIVHFSLLCMIVKLYSSLWMKFKSKFKLKEFHRVLNSQLISAGKWLGRQSLSDDSITIYLCERYLTNNSKFTDNNRPWVGNVRQASRKIRLGRVHFTISKITDKWLHEHKQPSWRQGTRLVGHWNKADHQHVSKNYNS